MTMKTWITYAVLIAIGVAAGIALDRTLLGGAGSGGGPGGGGAGGTGAQGGRKVLYWQAPMDPTYIRNEPGKSPMGMDLVPVYEDQAQNGDVIAIDPQVALNMGVRTALVSEGPLVREIRTVAHLGVNEELEYDVTNKFDGWIDKLRVDKTGEHVNKGDVLFEMYSKELVPAQTSYLESLADPRLTDPNVSKEERARARSILESTRRRFLLWDVPESWLDDLQKSRKVRRTVPVRAPASGIVLEKPAIEGRFFKAGTNLYRIASLESVWALASIYESERPFVKKGQAATMSLSYIPGRVFKGHVDYVYPYVNPKTRDISVRLVFPNEEMELLPDMYADVSLKGKIKDRTVLVPDSAVIDTGARQVVFIAKEKGKFEPREVQLGVLGEDSMREVLHGLKPGEEVVISAQFMLDSESRIREAIRKLTKPKAAEHEGHEGHAHETENIPQAAAADGPLGGVPPRARKVGDVIYLENENCPVLGGPVDGGYSTVWEGLRVDFCCPGCDKTFLKDPRGYLKKIGVDPDKVKAAFLEGAPPRPASRPASRPGKDG